MTIILFLIDTSGSMNQRTHNGARSTLLDVAKETIEKIIRLRQRDQSARTDRYMLLTFDEAPYNIKAGWKENHQVFLNELKNLSANGMTTIGTALKNAFDYLNLNRMVSGIDTYGAGRCPYYNETAIIISITDGGKYTNTTNVQRDLILPMNSVAFGADLTQEPFRWDQRLYSLVLRLSGAYAGDNTKDYSNSVQCNVPADESPIDAMCSVTGGRSYCITSIKALNASIENLATRMHNGVVLYFQKIGPDPPAVQDDDNFDASKFANFDVYQYSKQTWTSVRNLIYVRSEPRQKPFGYGNWPIPETFNPEPSLTALPPRTALPVVKFTCTNTEPAMLQNLPFDKYELDPSPLTQYILSRRQPNVAWQCYVQNTSRSELGHPFGYLKASTSLTCVNLFVFPYNYPVLLPLLNEFIVHQGKVSREWRQQFDSYIKTMPIYYGPSLKKAMGKMNINANLFPIPDIETHMHANITNHIKKQKNLAKIEADKLSAAVGLTRAIPIDWPRATNSSLFSVSYGRKPGSLSEGSYGSNPVLRRVFSNLQNDQDFAGLVIRYKEKCKSRTKVPSHHNPYDVDRHNMITQLNKLRDSYFQKQATSIRCQDEDVLHNLPVSQMGNYQDYIKKLPQPLRELESTPTRQHMFGNPFKIDRKNPSMLIDEADMADMAGGGGAGPGGASISKGTKRPGETFAPPPPKKKKGPIARDSPYYRTPPPSPNPHMSPPHLNGLYPPTPPASPQMIIITQDSFLPPAASPSSPSPSSIASSVALTSCSVVVSSPFSPQNSFIPIPPTSNDISNGANNTLFPLSNGNETIANNANKLNQNNKPSKFYNENNFALLSNHMANSSRIASPPKIENSLQRSNNPMVNGNGSKTLKRTSLKCSFQNGTLGKYPFGDYHTLMLDTFRKKNLSKEEFETKMSLLNLAQNPRNDYNVLLKTLASIDGHFGEYLLYEVFETAFRFNITSLLHQLKRNFPEKGDRLFRMYNLKSLPETNKI